MPETVTTLVPGPKIVWGKLPFWKKFLVRAGRTVSVGRFLPPGASDALEYFIFTCDKCGQLHVDYWHGGGIDSKRSYLSCQSKKVAD